MRIKHKVRAPRHPKPPEISVKYQAEVDRSTDKLRRRYERAQKAVEVAQFRRDRAALIVGQAKLRAERLANAEAALTARMAELAEIERLMTTPPAGGLRHRGTAGWTKVPR